jgi:hypothetical protein
LLGCAFDETRRLHRWHTASDARDGGAVVAVAVAVPGLGVDFFHCNKCKACLAISLQNNHRCVEDVLNTNCPICWEHLFTSRYASHDHAPQRT